MNPPTEPTKESAAARADERPASVRTELIAGVNVGGRTGLTSVFTALCFLPCFFIAPLAGMVPSYALPAFLTIVLIPLTFSIMQGILWGFVSHAGLYTIAGRAREVGPVMYALALVSVGLLLLEKLA